MKRFLILILVVFLTNTIFAGKLTGTYSFSKGLNKANATVYVNQFSEDSAFIYITAISGMPDFNTLDFRGFIYLVENKGSYIFKDSCKIYFTFSGNSLSIVEDSICKLPCSLASKYKKTSPVLKKSSTIISEFVEKNGKIKNDSTLIYKIPLLESEISCSILKETPIKITDEYKQFYLIELKNKQNEFLWVLKKNIQLFK